MIEGDMPVRNDIGLVRRLTRKADQQGVRPEMLRPPTAIGTDTIASGSSSGLSLARRPMPAPAAHRVLASVVVDLYGVCERQEPDNVRWFYEHTHFGGDHGLIYPLPKRLDGTHRILDAQLHGIVAGLYVDVARDRSRMTLSLRTHRDFEAFEDNGLRRSIDRFLGDHLVRLDARTDSTCDKIGMRKVKDMVIDAYLDPQVARQAKYAYAHFI